ncbi:MAG: cupin domain-containing protein [Pseudomonadota bacterium]
MLVKSMSTCQPFEAVDGCLIRELLHPKNDAIAEDFSLAFAEVSPGHATYQHRLEQVEVYYVLAGQGLMHIDDEAKTVKPGDAIYIPSQAVQWIENKGSEALKFLAIVAPPWSLQGDTRL